MRILLLSAYEAVSHRRWRQGLVAHLDDCHWTELTLPPRHFAWRIRGNPLSWLQAPELAGDYDVLMATGTVDLATIRGLHPSLAGLPAVLYLHENQFAYPASDRQRDSLEPRLVQLYAALAANRVAFNSDYNRETFLDGVEALVAGFPDHRPAGVRECLAARSEVLPVPLDPAWYAERAARAGEPGPLRLVWNHRWEYDKGPEALLAFLECLEVDGVDYRLDLLGQAFRRRPEPLEAIRSRFGHRLGQQQPLEDEDAYRQRLRVSDVVLSTARHDFQGLAVLEAVAAGCRPLVPDRLAYPEFFDATWRYPSWPRDPAREARAMADRLASVSRRSPPRVDDLAWPRRAASYRGLLEGARRDASGP